MKKKTLIFGTLQHKIDLMKIEPYNFKENHKTKQKSRLYLKKKYTYTFN